MEDVIVFLLLALFVAVVVFFKWTVWSSDVVSGKQFQIHNSVYQCKKTQELILEERK